MWSGVGHDNLLRYLRLRYYLDLRMRVWYPSSRGVKPMKTISTFATVIAFGLALGACTSETTTMGQDPLDGVGGSDSTDMSQVASVGGSSVLVTTVVQFVEVPKEVVKISACVPGAQTGCVCTDGSNGAQVCQDDGTMGACVCEVPQGYSGECVGVAAVNGATVGIYPGACAPDQPMLRVNCSVKPAGCTALNASSPGGKLPGVYCCVN